MSSFYREKGRGKCQKELLQNNNFEERYEEEKDLLIEKEINGKEQVKSQ